VDRQSQTGFSADSGSMLTYSDASPLLLAEVDKVHQLEIETRDLLEENKRFAFCVKTVQCCDMMS